MRILKMAIRLLAIISLAVLLITHEVLSAVFLLIFGSMSLGIMLGKKLMEEEITNENAVSRGNKKRT